MTFHYIISFSCWAQYVGIKPSSRNLVVRGKSPKRLVLSTEISLGERALLRKIVEKTGRSESDILTEARALSNAHDDVLIALDGILRNLLD
jgi:hypothetical protein